MMSQRSALIKVWLIAALFTLAGGNALYEMIVESGTPAFKLRIDALEIFVGIFLFLRREAARKWAVGLSVVHILLCAIGGSLALFGTFEETPKDLSGLQTRSLLFVGAIALGLFSYWIYRTLRSVPVKALFPDPNLLSTKFSNESV